MTAPSTGTASLDSATGLFTWQVPAGHATGVFVTIVARVRQTQRTTQLHQKEFQIMVMPEPPSFAAKQAGKDRASRDGQYASKPRGKRRAK
jgi:hypothetical protein